MKKVKKSVIRLSEIPENLQKNEIFNGHKIHTYAEFHIDNCENDELTNWLISNYPTIKRKTSFLIHIDKEIENNRMFSENEIEKLQSKVHKITGDGEVMMLFNEMLGINTGT